MANIKSIEIKYDKNNRPYKSATLDEQVMGKDRFNVFSHHHRYEDVVVGRDFAPEEFVQDGQYINLADPNKGIKTAYSPKKTFEVAKTMETKRENILEAQGNKEYGIKIASTASSATAITVELMKADPLLDWHTTWTDVRNWLWNHWDIEKPDKPVY